MEIKKTLVYTYDYGTFLMEWSGGQSNRITVGDVDVLVIKDPQGKIRSDLHRKIYPLSTPSESLHIIDDSARLKLDNYQVLNEVFEELGIETIKTLPSKGLWDVRGKDLSEVFEDHDGEYFIIRPNNQTRSADAFKIINRKDNPFRIKQFDETYNIFKNARVEHKGLTEDKFKIFKDIFRANGAHFLSDASQLVYDPSNQKATNVTLFDFFIQPFFNMEKELRIIKACPGQYFAYEYSKSKGVVNDASKVHLKPLKDILPLNIYEDVVKVFEHPKLPFCCALDLGIGLEDEPEYVIHEYSSSFSTEEYTPKDINMLSHTHIEGIIKYYQEL